MAKNRKKYSSSTIKAQSQKDQPQKVLVQTSYSGPLPHEDAIAKYEMACAGAADRIIAMTENQSNHRIKIEEMAQESICKESESICRGYERGQLYAFLTAIAAFGFGCTTALLGEIGAGIAIGTVPTIVIVFVSFYDRIKRK